MKKRIAYVVHSLNPGGTERLAADMALALQKEYDIRIICLDEPGIWADPVRAAGIPVISFYRQPGLDLRLPVMLACYAEKNRIDFFHAHQTTPWFYAGLSRLIQPKTKLVFEEHGRHYPEFLNKKKRLFNRMVLQKLTNTVVAVSRDVKDRLVSYEGIDPKKIQVVYNGTRPLPPMTPKDRNALRHRLGFQENDIVAGFIGRLDPIKNLPLILEGFLRAFRQCPALKLLIIGDGPMMAQTKDSIRQLNIQKQVTLAGYQPDAAKLAPAMDIFLLVSFSEGTSMALLEAMSAGVPAIVTRVGGNPEIVVHDQTGWIIFSDDPDALTKALVEAATDREKCQTMGTNAEKRFLEKFTFNRMIQHYQTIYRES
jgi:L-malate glycosyltransferase